jgi:hypothetical protein
MARHRSHSTQASGRFVEHHAWETLHALVRRHDLSRNLIRIWVQRNACRRRHFTFLATEYGKARSDKAIGSVMSEAARTTGLINKMAHGLRVTGAVALEEGGA